MAGFVTNICSRCLGLNLVDPWTLDDPLCVGFCMLPYHTIERRRIQSLSDLFDHHADA